MSKKYWNVNITLNKEKDKNIGNTYTHTNISTKLLKHFFKGKEINKKTKILEPSVGYGGFYFPILDYIIKNTNIELEYIVENILYGKDIEVSGLDYIIAKLKNDYNYNGDKALLYNEDYLLSENEYFDFIITNPPYISNKNIIPSKISNIETKKEYVNKIREIDQNIESISDIYMYFFIKSINLLNKNGEILFLCSDKWIDAKYGDILKKYLKEEKIYLKEIINSNYYPFFSDGTNAICTIMSKEKNETVNIFNIINKNLDIENPSLTLNNDEFIEILLNKKKYKNIKNYILFYPEEYLYHFNFIKKYKKSFIKLSDIVEIKSSSLSFNKIKEFIVNKENLNENEEYLNVFYFDQARVGKPALYKNFIEEKDTKYFINKKELNKIDKVEKYLIKNKGIFFMNTIDRMPLTFLYENENTIHLSKYFYIEFKDEFNHLPQKLLNILINNIFSINSLEIFIKDSTRRSLRTGENGYAKEVTMPELKEILVPNLSLLSNTEINKLIELSEKYENEIIFNMEKLLKEKNYLEIQNILNKSLFINNDLNKNINNTVISYLKRMRNLKRINIE